MGKQSPAGSQGGNAQHDAAASVGHATSGEAGATREHETMGETGGSGGAGLTATQVGETGQSVQSGTAQSGAAQAGAAQPGAAPSPAAPRRRDGLPGAEPGVVMDSGARGAQDTRSRQAGGTGTGLGVPETGANQTPADLEHVPGGKRRP